MALFHLSIITPKGEVFTGDIESLVAPGEEGYLGVMASHAPMIASLKQGALTARGPEGALFFAVGAGVLEVAENQALVLVDDAEHAENVDAASLRSKALTAHHY
jgi:F-type H+-transporting ATPase subunit epsilon